MTAETVGLFHNEYKNKERIFYGDPVFHAVYCALNGDLKTVQNGSAYIDPTKFDPMIQRDMMRIMFWVTDNQDPHRHVFVPPNLKTNNQAASFKEMVHNSLIEDPMATYIDFGGTRYNIARVAREVGLEQSYEDYLQAHPGKTDYEKVFHGLEQMYSLKCRYEEKMSGPMRSIDDKERMEKRIKLNLFTSIKDMQSYFVTLLGNMSYVFESRNATRVIDYMYNQVLGRRQTATTIARESGISELGYDGRAVDDILDPSRGGRCFIIPEKSSLRLIGKRPPLVYGLDQHPFVDNQKWGYKNLLPSPCFKSDGSVCPLLTSCTTVFEETQQQDMSVLRVEAEELLDLFQKGIGEFQDRTNTIIIVG